MTNYLPRHNIAFDSIRTFHVWLLLVDGLCCHSISRNAVVVLLTWHQKSSKSIPDWFQEQNIAKHDWWRITNFVKGNSIETVLFMMIFRKARSLSLGLRTQTYLPQLRQYHACLFDIKPWCRISWDFILFYSGQEPNRFSLWWWTVIYKSLAVKRNRKQCVRTRSWKHSNCLVWTISSWLTDR